MIENAIKNIFLIVCKAFLTHLFYYIYDFLNKSNFIFFIYINIIGPNLYFESMKNN